MMPPFPLPADETERLAALNRYAILDTAPEESIDAVARAAALLFDAPVSAVAFIDADRVWFKTGSGVSQIPRGGSFCGHAIAEHNVRVVADTMTDPMFRDIPIFDETGARVRFYAGAPLVTPDGYRIGTLSVTDRLPHRALRDDQPKILAALAQIVMAELERRIDEANITERRQRDAVNQGREKDFELLFSRAPIAMMLSDVETCRYEFVNEAAARLFGYSQEQFRAMTVDDIRPPEERDAYAAMAESPSGADGRRGVCHYRKADGSVIPVDVTVHLMMYRGRRTALTVAADLSEQKRIEHAMRDARDTAIQASRAKTEFLANMSHELRTPLNAIIGFSEIMRSEMFGPLGSRRYLGYTDDIALSAKHLLVLINDILDLAKMEAKYLELREENVDVAKLMTNAVHLAGPNAEFAGIEVMVRSTLRNPIIRADETALKRVLVNLLSNAVKFSTAGSTVLLSADETAAGDLLISVEDHGIGIAPGDIAVALTPFRQIDSGMSRKYMGTGLGLPIVKQLVELHGGRLIIDSELGVGTTVGIEIPVSRIVEGGAASQAEPLAAHA